MSQEPQTIPELLFARAARDPDGPAVLTKRDGRWQSESWRELEQRVRRVAAAIAEWIAPGQMACILSENRPEWWIADLATLAVGGVSAPIYPTSPPRDIAYIVGDCGARLLFVSSAAQLQKVQQLRADGELAQLERVVVFDDEADADVGDLPVISLARLCVDSDSAAPGLLAERMAAITADQLATLIYTSGTTGEPKGVMLSHGNIVSNVLGAHVLLDHLDRVMPGGERLMLSFLPLSHSFERTAGYYVAIHYGFTVAFAEGIAQLVDNMGEVRPTVLVSVPRIYEKLHARVMQQAASSPVKQRLIRTALAIGGRHARCRLAEQRAPLHLALLNRLAERVVFSKIKARLGGRLQFAISGGAPLSREIANFLNAFGLAVFEGYGLSETSPVLTANRPGAIRVGSVGKPFPGVEIRIAPEPDREHDGEVLARGPIIMRGYFNKPEATAEVLDAEGWFHTGDIGHVDADGFLFITDRKKELIKTAGGKYVAPQPLENQLKVHPLVEQAVVIGDRRKYCVVLIVPAFEALEQALGRPLPADRSRLGEDPEVRRLYQAAIEALNAGRGSWEQIKRFALLPAELTQETGELTPSLKLKRRVIEDRHRAVIDALYPD